MNRAKRYYLALVFLLIFHSSAFAGSRIDLRRIIAIESAGNVRAYNSRSKARGLCQITPICLKEYNNFHKVKYTEVDLFNPDINKAIALWYLEIRIPQMLRHYRLSDTIANRLCAYNWGIGNLRKFRDNIENMTPQETKDYITKYERR